MSEHFFARMLEASNTFNACFQRVVITDDEVVVMSEQWREFFKHVSVDENISLHYLTAIDHKDTMEIVCRLHNIVSHDYVIVRCVVDNNTIDSISKFFEVASFYEREIMEMFGIHVQGLENTNVLLTRDGMIAHPLRKVVALEERVNWPGGFDPARRRRRTTIGELQ